MNKYDATKAALDALSELNEYIPRTDKDARERVKQAHALIAGL